MTFDLEIKTAAFQSSPLLVQKISGPYYPPMLRKSPKTNFGKKKQPLTPKQTKRYKDIFQMKKSLIIIIKIYRDYIVHKTFSN